MKTKSMILMAILLLKGTCGGQAPDAQAAFDQEWDQSNRMVRGRSLTASSKPKRPSTMHDSSRTRSNNEAKRANNRVEVQELPETPARLLAMRMQRQRPLKHGLRKAAG